MAQRLPRPLRRRDILYGVSTPAEELAALGPAYFEQDMLFDAADFFVEARDREGLSRIRERAIETGDAFLLGRVRDGLPELVSDQDWKDLARNAAASGKEAYVARAESGGARPPPPLQEELAGNDSADTDPQEPKPSTSGRRTKKTAVQGG